jgi:hypothetical protein
VREQLRQASAGLGILIAGIRAWLVEWEWAGGHAAVDPPFIALLPWQWRDRRVIDFVEATWAAQSLDTAVMFAKGRGRLPYKAALVPIPVRSRSSGESLWVPWAAWIMCGDNPWINARQVTHVREDEHGRLLWDKFEPPTEVP